MPINPNEELTPETSQEAFTARTYDPMQPVPEEAETNMEAYIKYLYDKTQRLPEKPDTREEYFMMIAGQNIGPGSDVEPLTVTENGTYSEAGKAYSPVTVEVPLPTNANERQSVTSYPVTDSANYPLPKCDVTVTDADKCEVIVTTDNTITEDSGVYIERQSGGGNRELDEIVGGSVVWNQLVKETDTSCTVQSGHKYVLKQGSTYTVVVSDGTAFTVDGSVNDNVYDLTALFGTTIADYIYSLEQSTAGSGIAWLKSYGYLTKDYYGYTANKIESVSVARHITRGFNQWDEQWEIGSINTATGEDEQNNSVIRCVGYIEAFPNTTYYVSNPEAVVIFFYDAENNFIDATTRQNQTFTTPSNTSFIRFRASYSYGTTYNHDICINISNPSKDGTYEPYHEHTYQINPITLRGIPKLNASNQLYYDGDRYEASGRVKRRYGIVDLGTLTWNLSANGHFFSTISNPAVNTDVTSIPNIICSVYQTGSVNTVYNKTVDGSITQGTVAYWGPTQIATYDSRYNDATTYKAAMNGVYLVYELATPTTESTSPFETNQIVDANGTEEYIDAGVDAGTRDVAIPVGHETKYFNGKAYVKPLTAGTSDTVSMADMGIMPTSPMYIEANGTVDAEYWKSNS